MPGRFVVSANADQRFRATVGNSGKHGGKLFVTHGSVLGINQQPVVTAVGQLLGDGRAVRVQEQTHLGRAFAQLLLEVGATKGGFGHSRFLLRVNSKFPSVTHRAGRFLGVTMTLGHQELTERPARPRPRAWATTDCPRAQELTCFGLFCEWSGTRAANMGSSFCIQKSKSKSAGEGARATRVRRRGR